MKQFFVLYDGIENSVFAGQVLEPLIKQRKPVTIISFERNTTRTQAHVPKLPSHISLCILKKFPFFGAISLRYAAYQLKTVLDNQAYTITARGPLVGWICLQALKPQHCKKLVVQARGLVAQEYQYVHRNKTGITRLLHAVRAHQYNTIEQTVFSYTTQKYHFSIEAVSPALKEHLRKTFDASTCITIASHDKPIRLSAEQKNSYRLAIRSQLNIEAAAHVYCYNGSAKTWQCPEMVIDFFIEKLRKNPYCILAILTPDVKPFELLCVQKKIPPAHYRIVHVPHNQILTYLAACDTGLLFREPHLINWVSRPTKILEYHAAHLTVEHNSTVSWVIDKKYK